MRQPSGTTLVTFIAIGLLVTIALEYCATQIAGRWEYADAMPRLPLLQWLLIPPLVAWLVRRQIP